MNNMPSWTRSELIVFFALAIIFGCASPPKNISIHKYPSLHTKCERQQYSDCLAEAETLLTRNLSATDWVEVMFTKALCLEETGRQQDADEIYKQVRAKNADSKSVFKARLRLLRMDSDQREHLEFDFGEEIWVCERRESRTNAFIRQFSPPVGSKLRSKRILFLASWDRPPQVRTQEDFLKGVSNSAGMNAGKLKFTAIERLQNEGIWMGQEVGRTGVVKSSALIRIILNPTRMHAAVYAQKSGGISEANQAVWVGRLKKCKLVITGVRDL